MVSSGSQPYQRPLPGRPPYPSPDPLCGNSRRYLQVFPGGKHLDPYRTDGYENLCAGDRSPKSPDPLCWSSWRGAIQNNRRGKNLGVRRHRANSEMDLCPGNRSRNPSNRLCRNRGRHLQNHEWRGNLEENHRGPDPSDHPLPDGRSPECPDRLRRNPGRRIQNRD